MDQRVRTLQSKLVPEKKVLNFNSGDTITVSYKIKEGDKERVQLFQGVVIQKKGTGNSETFTVRKMSSGVGVERIFISSSPFIENIEINRKGLVRRARVFYLRERTGKSARVKEKRMPSTAKSKKG